jgi:hypothetical protein
MTQVLTPAQMLTLINQTYSNHEMVVINLKQILSTGIEFYIRLDVENLKYNLAEFNFYNSFKVFDDNDGYLFIEEFTTK